MLYITKINYESAKPGDYLISLLNAGYREVKRYSWHANYQDVKVMAKRLWKFPWQQWQSGGRW